MKEIIPLTTIKSIESEKKNVSEAEKGKQVAISLDKVTIGRQISEGDILYSVIPENDFRKLSAEARSKVDPRLLVSFERIRKNYRNGLAVVSIVRDACGGCFNAIPPQKQSEIRQHKKIMVCENCGRVLVDTDLHASIVIK